MTDRLREGLWRALLAMQRDARGQGVASHAALDDGDVPMVRLLAREAITRQDERGRLSARGDGALVSCGSMGEAVAMLAREGESGAEDALDRQSLWLLEKCPRGDSGILYHDEGATEVWADTVYLTLPFLVTIGHDAREWGADPGPAVPLGRDLGQSLGLGVGACGGQQLDAADFAGFMQLAHLVQIERLGFQIGGRCLAFRSQDLAVLFDVLSPEPESSGKHER